MIFQEQYKAKIDALQTKLFEERISNYDEYLAAAAIIFSELNISVVNVSQLEIRRISSIVANKHLLEQQKRNNQCDRKPPLDHQRAHPTVVRY